MSLSFTKLLVICVTTGLIPPVILGQVDTWRLTSTTIPSDTRLIPAVGNGHVATQVYTDTMYVNSVMNGNTNTSHRARVPSTASLELVLEDPTNVLYTLEMNNGVFLGSFETEQFTAEQRIYAHRTRTRIVVNEFTVTRQGGVTGDLVIGLTLDQGPPSDDLILTTNDHDVNTFYTSGPIVEPETVTSGTPIIHQYWTKVPASVTLLDGQTTATWRYLTAISIDQSDALTEFTNANSTDSSELWTEHVSAWQNIWQGGNIDVVDEIGGTELGQTLRAAMFHILISTPDQDDPINPFMGLSPGGLARGGIVNNKTTPYNDYLGHVFWDMDTWIMPAILMFHPDKARLMINSRYRVIEAARDLAAERGLDGIRYPWELGYSGYETCGWDLASLYQIHVTADVSFSIRQYLYSTEDLDFVANGGGQELALEIARFWRSRSVLQDVDKGYEILGVMGPDENNANVNNSVFTNFNAVRSLSLPQYLIDKLNISFSPEELAEVTEFNNIANSMYLPFNDQLQYHPQYDGFQIIGNTIKQADVVLLGYPLMKEMTGEVRENDLVLYEELTDEFGPDTGTWSMHTVGWLELGNVSKAQEMFEFMFRNINGPFKIFSEKPETGPDGMRATNFITLAGGMLQAILFGYGGIRVHPTHMDMSTVPLPNSTQWTMTGLHYRGSTLDVITDVDDVTITLTNQEPGAEDLVLITPAGRQVMSIGADVTLSRAPITVVTVSDEANMPAREI